MNPSDENGSGNKTVWIYHKAIQKVVNDFFNSAIPLGDLTTKSDIFPLKRKSFSSLLPPISNSTSTGAISQIAYTNVPTVAQHKVILIPDVS